MALWFRLRCNDEHLGTCVIQRTEHLDLSDPAAIADEVCTYTVTIDGKAEILVEHRYGDGAWELVRKALEAVARKRERGVHLTALVREAGEFGLHELTAEPQETR